MKKIMAAVAAALLFGGLLTACENPPACEDDYLTSSVITGKGGGSKSRSYSRPRLSKSKAHGSTKHRTSHGSHHDWDDDCDD